MKLIILPFLLFLLSVVPVRGSSGLFFTVIDGNAGLSQNNVKALIQDSYGFMWFGTRNQLNRYDGVSIKIYDCYDLVARVGNNNISALFEAPDRKLWIGTDNGVYLFDPLVETFSRFGKTTSNGESIEQWVFDIQADNEQNIWVVVPNQGVFKYSLPEDRLTLYPVVDKLMPNSSNPQCIAIEDNGRVWVGTNRHGVYLYNKATDDFTQYLGDENEQTLAGQNIYAMCHYEDELIIGIHEGRLVKLNKKRNVLSDVLFPDANYKIIRSITLLNDDELWVGTEDGLYVMNEKKQYLKHIFNDPLNKNSLSDNFIERICMDREGGIWIGTHFGGVNYLPARNNTFEQFVPLSKTNSITSKRIREMQEDNAGRIWIGTEDAGVDVYDPGKGSFTHVGHLHYGKTLAMLIQDGKALIGYFKNGLDVVDMRHGMSVRHYSERALGLNEASIYAMCEDRYGQIWIGNAWGVYMARKNSLRFERMKMFGSFYSYDIMEDSEGYIWVATMGNGIYQYDQDKKELKHFVADGGERSLSSNSVSSITEDYLGRMWFSTDRGGISMYDKNSGLFTSYSIEDGLPDDVAYKILEDKQHNLWFGTDKGLVRFNPDTKDIRVFTRKDGLVSSQFNYKSGLKTNQGKFYFGSLEGLLAFDPDNFEDNRYIPPVYLTRITVNNEEIHPLDKSGILRQGISHARKIVLKHNQSTISFDFVALSYTAPLANTYMYKMENIDTEWTTTTANRSAAYAKLPPGKYTFRVKGSNNDGHWNEQGASIDIEILPAWWASRVAYVAYFIVSGVLLSFVVRYYIRRSRRHNNERQRLFEMEKEKELYEAKVTFFTDIAHEIRTPVTLINGPLESILEMPIQDDELKRNLLIIERNTQHLLNLINQLLDFRKVDANKVTMSFRYTDINQLVEECKERFEEAPHVGDKRVTISLPAEHVHAYVDKDAFSKIVNNLFANAMKYSDKSVNVQLVSDAEHFTVRFTNDGELVPDEAREKIFDPFFRVRTSGVGSGIGLSLARSLAELHDGSLVYEVEGALNVFVLRMPLSQKDVANVLLDDGPTSKDDFVISRGGNTLGMSNLETMLVVEDNVEMLDFIVDKLKKHYIVETAANGNEALEVLGEKNVSIVVSDLMMPQMDGFELCKAIKSSLEYSHIIFIMLTAKNDLASKIKGLELGADAYVEKPFSFQYFTALLSSLLNNKRREKELFLQKPFLPIQQVGMNKADEQFMNKIIDIINENITDSGFNVERLAELAFMSRSSLHRKFKSLLELSPTDFIRIVRLKKAAQLIKENGSRANEVCYLVGINSPSYFIKLFQRQFGMTPKEFERQEGEGTK